MSSPSSMPTSDNVESTDSDENEGGRPKPIIRHSSSKGDHSKRKSILIRRHSEPSSPDESASGLPSSIIKDKQRTGTGDSINSTVSSETNNDDQIGPAPKASSFSNSEAPQIKIRLSDTLFTIDLDLIQARPETQLGRMFSPANMNTITRPNASGEYELNSHICIQCFQAVLNFYKTNIVRCPSTCSVREIKEACDYFLVPFDIKSVKCDNLRAFLHELSNQGAREKFQEHLEDVILPKLHASAIKGERECELIVCAEDDIIDWHKEYPPPLGEEHGQVIISNKLVKFFKYAENREVAKQVMKDRGLRKIKMGVEGYPTTLDRIKTKADGRQEAIYNYIQRPFIHVSWEYEDARHVDFQCVRSVTDPMPLVLAAAEHEQDAQFVRGEMGRRQETQDDHEMDNLADDLANQRVAFNIGAPPIPPNHAPTVSSPPHTAASSMLPASSSASRNA